MNSYKHHTWTVEQVSKRKKSGPYRTAVHGRFVIGLPEKKINEQLYHSSHSSHI
jgi:beta-lactamase superfamily II metal-dependent hydrolase